MHSEKAEKVSYYNTTSVEAIDFIELLALPFALANALKYIMRSNSISPKGEDPIKELDKIMYYLNRELKGFHYTWQPSPHFSVITTMTRELEKQLPKPMFHAFWWTMLYVKCNKIREPREVKMRYLSTAIQILSDYKNEMEKFK